MSDDPTRLLDDAGAPQALRDTLRAALEHDAPIHPSGLERLEQTIARGGASAGTSTGSAALASHHVIGIASASIVVVSAAAIMLGGWSRSDAPSRGVESSEVIVAADTVDDVSADNIDAPAIEVTPAPAIEAEPEIVPAGATSPAAISVRDRHRQSPPDSEALEREMGRIAEAQRSLARDPARSLALIDESRREMPQSPFAEERDALHILALAQLGRPDDARREGERFLARHATSTFAERVRRAIEAR